MPPNTTIYSKGIPVPQLDDSKHLFHNRLTLIIGPSGSGKSALTQHILNSLRTVIPLIVVACPTASVNGDYNNIVPDVCVHEDLTKTLIQKIFQRQDNMVQMYQKIHDIHYIKPLFNMIAREEAIITMGKLKEIFNNGCREIREKMEERDIEACIDALKEKYTKKLVKHMRKFILEHIDELIARRASLNNTQRSIVESFNINPSLVLIADDCMATVKEWSPLPETKKLFFQGRHYHLTTIILCQATTLLPPQLRSNAHITILTTEQIVNAYVKNDSSGYSNEDQKKIKKIAETVFAPSQNANKKNYTKLVIMGAIIKTDYAIQYILAAPRKKRFGAQPMWEVCNKVKGTGGKSNNESFNKMFSIKSEDSSSRVSP